MKISEIIPKNMNEKLIKIIEKLMLRSLEAAAKEQFPGNLISRLENIVPDITNQYTTFSLDTPYLKRKGRNQHAFQISLVNEVMKDFKEPVIVDIGDSCGTHLQYLTGLHGHEKKIKCLSVNLDKHAIDRIKNKGLNALHARAEDIENYGMKADIFLCFQMLEHVMDPCRFLYQLSQNTTARYLIITVPYLAESRIGLSYIRGSFKKSEATAENTHIFELDPEDWKLIARHSGWEVHKEKIYRQYPKNGFLRLTKGLWKRLDFEGFYGLILKRDDKWSTKYKDWNYEKNKTT